MTDAADIGIVSVGPVGVGMAGDGKLGVADAGPHVAAALVICWTSS